MKDTSHLVPPSTFVGLLLFLWLITPGFVFNWLACRRRAQAVETTFQEASRVVLASAVFSTAAGLLVVGVDLLLGLVGHGLDLGRVITADKPYLRTKVGALGAILLLQIALACGLAWLADRVIRKRFTKLEDRPPPQLRAESAWTEPLSKRLPGASVRAWVRLKSGLELHGKVASVTHDIPIADRELVLTMPLHILRPDGSSQELEWEWVVVQGPDIEALAIRYERNEDA